MDHEQYWRGYFSPNGQNYLAERNGTFVGLVRVVGPTDEGDAELMSLWVDPAVRGQKIGERLVGACWSWLQLTAPGGSLRLSVHRENLPARELYERIGFVLVGPDPEDATEDVLVKQPVR